MSEEPDDCDRDRGRDPFAPPEEPCECWCLHCHRVFMSSEIWLQRVIGDPSGFPGMWMCPTPNCDGAGYRFDIYPTDPDHPDNAGWSSYCDDEERAEFEGEDEDGAMAAEFGEDEDEEEIIEGDEWKLGVRPDEAAFAEPDRSQQRIDPEEARYDQPDERPREIIWQPPKDGEARRHSGDDDIPF